MTTYLQWLKSVGVDLARTGAAAPVALPGGSKDGTPANFTVGQTYTAAAFARFAKVKPTGSRVKVTGGSACRAVGRSVQFTGTGKCSLTLRRGKRRIPIIVRVYG